MIGQEDLQELLEFEAGDAKVVSLYLNADTTQQTNETIKLQARTLMKEAECDEKDASAIEHYLNFSHPWGKPGLAVFSCAAHDFFRAYPSNVAYRQRIRIGNRPYVKPLTHLLDHYAHYGVILVDRVGARYFEYHLGELQDQEGTAGEDVRKLKLGGGSSRGGGSSSATGQRGGEGARREEEVALRNMREAASVAQTFFARKPIRRLFIGGTNENVAQFREYLPKILQSRIAGTFPIDMTAGEHEIRERALQLLQEANAERERKLVDSMITTAAKGGNAVTGVDATLKMVNEGRVQTLILSDGFRTSGYVDRDVSYLTLYQDVAPFASEEMTKVEDVVELAVAKTMSQGGIVEIISENPQLEDAGRIGAILHY